MPYTDAERQLKTTLIQAAMQPPRQLSLRAASAEAEVPVATARLWLSNLEARGTVADARRENSGRNPLCPLTPAEAAALRKLVLERRLSENSAIQAFVKDKACTPATKAFIEGRIKASRSGHRTEARPPRWPDSLRRAAHVTEAEVNRWYGPDATRSNYIPSQRRLTIVEKTGIEIPMRPHMVWEFDDYSTNKPYYLEYAEGKFRCCRQILAGLDAFTHAWLGFYHVGKERDQYTGGDCLTIILRCIDAHQTKPKIIILEKGRWHSNAVRGIDMGNGRRWGNIEDCGIIVRFGIDSRDKAEIEAGFLPLQIELNGGADIGHTRGLHERESDSYMAVNAGRRDPRHCGFSSIAESDAEHFNAACLLNDRRKQRQDLGYVSPNELFEEFPVEQNPLAPEHRWLFERPFKTEATVGSHGSDLVGCTVDKKKHLFVVNGIRDDVFLDNGHKVFIAFDPERPDKGCTVANADMSTGNRDHWRLGEMLLPTAPSWGSLPRVDLRSMDEQDADNVAHFRKRQGTIRAAQTAFTAILPGGKRGLRTASRVTREGKLREAMFDPNQADDEPTATNGAKSRAADAAVCPRAHGNDFGGLEKVRTHPRLKSAPAAPQHEAAEDGDLEALEAEAMRRAGVMPCGHGEWANG